MKRKVLITTILLGVLAVATVFGVTAYRTASAAAAYGLSPVAQVVSRGSFAAGNFDTATGDASQAGMDRGPRGGQTDEQLAKALGITTDELQAAYTKANEAALAQAVKDGLITQAQADEFTANGSAFSMGGRGMSGQMFGWLQQKGIDYEALLANALGIRVEDLQAARLEARSAAIDQAVTDGTMTQEQADLMKAREALFSSQSFQDSLKSAYETAVQQAVKDGVITQAQADLILKSSPNGFGPMGGAMGGALGGDMGGGPGRHGGRGGFGPQDPGSNQAPQAPSSTPTANGL